MSTAAACLCPLIVLIQNEQQGLTLTLRMSLKDFLCFSVYTLLCISVLVFLSVVKHAVPCLVKWGSAQSPKGFSIVVQAHKMA